MFAPTLETSGAEKLLMRVHGDPAHPALVYLPGLHGDWSLVSSFRTLAQQKFCFVEFTYPRTTAWSLPDYAREIEQRLATLNLRDPWLLAESFGSQPAWELLGRDPHRSFSGLILAGGFVKHPSRLGVLSARFLLGALPPFGWRILFAAYVRYARFRHRHAPETMRHIHEFIARRTPQDVAAMRARLALIAANDPRPTAARVTLPVYLLAGTVDPIVPILSVRRWLANHCPGYRQTRILWPADHNVLGTEPAQSLAQIESWIATTLPLAPK